jgi:hypothetical protein
MDYWFSEVLTVLPTCLLCASASQKPAAETNSLKFYWFVWQPVLLASSSLLTKPFYGTHDKTPSGSLTSQLDAEM